MIGNMTTLRCKTILEPSSLRTGSQTKRALPVLSSPNKRYLLSQRHIARAQDEKEVQGFEIEVSRPSLGRLHLTSTVYTSIFWGEGLINFDSLCPRRRTQSQKLPKRRQRLTVFEQLNALWWWAPGKLNAKGVGIFTSQQRVTQSILLPQELNFRTFLTIGTVQCAVLRSRCLSHVSKRLQDLQRIKVMVLERIA